MYMYVIPNGGFTDCLNALYYCIEYCKKHNRVLLFDFINSRYKVNFSDYFELDDKNVIYDSNKIREIVLGQNFTVYPVEFQDKFVDIVQGKFKLAPPEGGGQYIIDKGLYTPPDERRNEEIILNAKFGNEGNDFLMFKRLSFKKNLIDYCINKTKVLNAGQDHECFLSNTVQI